MLKSWSATSSFQSPPALPQPLPRQGDVRVSVYSAPSTHCKAMSVPSHGQRTHSTQTKTKEKGEVARKVRPLLCSFIRKEHSTAAYSSTSWSFSACFPNGLFSRRDDPRRYTCFHLSYAVMMLYKSHTPAPVLLPHPTPNHWAQTFSHSRRKLCQTSLTTLRVYASLSYYLSRWIVTMVVSSQ